MRIRSILSEAWRNVVSGTALSAQLAALLGLVAVSTILFGGLEVAAISRQATQFRESGAAVLVVAAKGAIDPTACEALDSTPGVRAGALRQARHNVVAAVLPASSIPTFEVTPRLASILSVRTSRQTDGVLVSRAAAQSLGVRGGQLTTTTGPLAVGGIYDYPRDGRRSDLEFAILAPSTSAAPFDECWAETWPPSDQLESLLRSTVIPGGKDGRTEAKLTQLNGTLGTTFDGAALYRERITRWLPLVAFVASLLLVLAATRLRRVELDSARHCGVSAVDQVAIVMVEATAWIAAVVVLSAAVAVAVASRGSPADTVAGLALGAAAVTSAGGLLGSTVGVLMSGERRLFRNVKGRR